MPTPSIKNVLDDRAVADLLEHLLQGGGQLPPAAAGEFTAFAALALRAFLDQECEAGAALRRLWQAAPVAEMREAIRIHFDGMREDGDPIPGLRHAR